MAWTPGRSRSPGTSSGRGTSRPHPRRSAGSCSRPADSRHSHESARDRPTRASRWPSPTSCGNRTSSTGASRTAPTSRSSTGLMTTPATCSPAPSHQPVTGDVVVATFLGVVEHYGPPASTLTDNGSVYTSRFTGGRNAFEYVLPVLGVRQKNGSPGHPQTQGKTERFHQTLQRWLAARPPTRTLAELQRQLDEFCEHYNERRPHRALDRRTPGDAYRATPKAAPASNGHTPGHYRLRYDRLDPKGKMTIR